MVPVMDMLRVELDPNGTFNVGEYGTVNDPELFQAMLAYSPYHNVKDGAAYPAVLLTAGESDPFAKAYHARRWQPACRQRPHPASQSSYG
jgi:prolyl oligopeptidase